MMSLFNLQRFATQKGTSSADNLVVKKAGNIVYGYAGNDNIINNYDKVTIVGGAGNDNVWSRGSNVQISGDAGNDFLISSGDSVKVSGGADNDSIFSSGSDATITGDAGNDYIEHLGDDSSISGGSGKDTVIAYRWDTVNGGKGDDFISFNYDSSYSYNRLQYADGDGDDTVYGFGSTDYFYITKGSYSTVQSGKNLILKIGKGSVTFLDAIGTPIRVFSSSGIVTIGGGNATTSGGKYISNYTDDTLVSGTSKGDTISNSGNYVTLSGGAGSDTIYTGYNSTDVSVSGGKGNDTISGYADYATINGGAGSDIVSLDTYSGSKNNIIQYASGDGNDTIFGFDSNDTLHITKGSYSTTKSGNDFIVTVGKQKITLKDAVDDDYDKVIIKNSAGKISTYNDWSVKSDAYGNSANDVKITTGSSSYYRYITNQSGDNVTLQGGEDSDNITNDYGNAVILTGGAGGDSLTNRSGNAVTLTGGAGGDTLTNNNGGAVVLTGGTGNDKINLGKNSGGNLINYASGDGNDVVYGFKAGDTLKITSGTYTATAKGTNVIVTVGSGKVTLRGAASKSVTIVDAKGKSSTKIYGAETSALFAEDNFAAADRLDSIIDNNLSATDYKVTAQNFENLTQENNLITFAEK